jgi:sulfatase maturation enzyme AslB (radical SAM superfamily)
MDELTFRSKNGDKVASIESIEAADYVDIYLRRSSTISSHARITRNRSIFQRLHDHFRYWNNVHSEDEWYQCHIYEKIQEFTKIAKSDVVKWEVELARRESKKLTTEERYNQTKKFVNDARRAVDSTLFTVPEKKVEPGENTTEKRIIHLEQK